MAKKTKASNAFTGRWRIVSMSAWEDDYLDEEVEAFIDFNDRDWGSFHFGSSGARWIVVNPPGTASQPWNGPGMGTPRWTPPRAEAGPCLKATNYAA